MGKICVAPPGVGIGEPVLLGSVSYDYITPNAGYISKIALPLARPMGDFRLVFVQGIGLRASSNSRYEPIDLIDSGGNMLARVNAGVKDAPQDALTALFIAPGGSRGYFSCKDSSRGDVWFPKGDFFDTSLQLRNDSAYLGSGTVKVWGIL